MCKALLYIELTWALKVKSKDRRTSKSRNTLVCIIVHYYIYNEYF